MTFGEKILQLLTTHRVTKATLSAELAINRGTLDNWIKGQSLPNYLEVQQLAKYFNVTVAELYDEPGDYKEKLIQTQETAINDLREQLKKVWQTVDLLVTKIPPAK